MTIPAILFISDLHLDPRRPAITRLFLDFLQAERGCGALYILGDLFEAWIGDDVTAGQEPVLEALAAFSRQTPLYFMHGNRDFLVGERFADVTGARLLPDPSLVDLFGQPTLLMHGDSLCVDDEEYQRFRRMVRDPAWQAEFLARPPAERIAYAQQARKVSSERNQGLAEYLMDVNPGEVESALRRHGVACLIHGHTHRPAVHSLDVDGRPCRRIVLGDWYEQGSVLRVTPAGWALEHLQAGG